jgi:mannose-6-phosphate isomerase
MDRPALDTAIRENRVGGSIRFHDVSAGDVVHIPPGTVHALCSGVMIYEVQQSSDLTFRLWDYDRPGPDGKPRELHTDRALDVIAFDRTTPRPVPWHELPGVTSNAGTLVDCPHYRLERFCAGEIPSEHRYASFAALTVIAGSGVATGEAASCPVRTGESALVPAGRRFSVACGSGASVDYLIASVP